MIFVFSDLWSRSHPNKLDQKLYWHHFTFNHAYHGLSKAEVPASFKTDIIKPLLKKEILDPDILNHDCPIANLAFLSKMLERVVAIIMSKSPYWWSSQFRDNAVILQETPFNRNSPSQDPGWYSYLYWSAKVRSLTPSGLNHSLQYSWSHYPPALSKTLIWHRRSYYI